MRPKPHRQSVVNPAANLFRNHLHASAPFRALCSNNSRLSRWVDPIRRRQFMRNNVLGMAAALPLFFARAWAQCPPDPTPTGPIVEPGQAFDPREYAYVHSSTNLQGYPAHEKTAA